MNRDPLYQQIRSALADRRFDGNTFERCAAAILGKAYPNLAPMPGGNDGGMDGAFGTSDGAFPLICTKESDVIGNFRNSVATYLDRYRGPRRAVVATSQALSNERKQNLHEAAIKLGVVLVNIHDAPFFEDHLYRDKDWRLELLGLIGDRPALSRLPVRGRSIDCELLIGRESELSWLQAVEGDALLVGQPGVGKTYLHQALANLGKCLFLVDPSSSSLANAIREQEPSIIVVDDAHVSPEQLELLAHLRLALGARFHIHANCWPGYEAEIVHALQLSLANVRHLERLTWRQVFDLVVALGIDGPDALQHLIVEQSEGKPGLAAALVRACKNKGTLGVWTGEAAAVELLGRLSISADTTEALLLATIALSGDHGLRLEELSRSLSLTPPQIRETTAQLANGGIVEQLPNQRLQVRPRVIRPILVRDTFFEGSITLQIAPYLNADYAAATAGVLCSARQCGAKVPQDLLEKCVLAANTPAAWEHFSCVDEYCARAVIDKYPAQIHFAAPGLLHHIPDESLNAILDADVCALAHGDESPRLRRSITDWLFPPDRLYAVAIEPRTILLTALESRVQRNLVGTCATFGWAIAALLHVAVNTTLPSPRSNREFKIVNAVAPVPTILAIAELWPRIKSLLRSVPPQYAKVIFDEVENWCLPQRLALSIPLGTELRGVLRKHGKRMLLELLDLPQCNRAWRTRARTALKWMQSKTEVAVDEAFDAIYGYREWQDGAGIEHERRVAELSGIALKLARSPRIPLIQRVGEMRKEAEELGLHKEDEHIAIVFEAIAQECAEPTAWIDDLIAYDSPPRFLMPFVDQLARVSSSDGEKVLGRLLELPKHRAFAVYRTLTSPAPSKFNLNRAIEVLNEPELVQQLWLRGADISVAIMAKLLTHSNPTVRGFAAIGEWLGEPSGTIREELKDEWRTAIMDAGPKHYALRDIFESDPSIAFEWLQKQISSADRWITLHENEIRYASSVCSKAQRAGLLRLLTRENYSDDCFDMLMGDDLDLYALWLELHATAYLRFQPLRREIDDRWIGMATIALDAGATPAEIAEHCMPVHWGGWGPMSDHFRKRIPAFEVLANHADPRLRLAGKRGLQWAQRHYEQELERERREEIFGE